jgi:carboxyl-terminal processing protease
MLMNSRKTASGVRGPLLFLLIFCASATLTTFYGVASLAAAPSNAPEAIESVRQFSRVLAAVQHSYAEPVDTEKIIYDGAIPGMLHVLDPHSNFFDPRQYDSFREEQEGKYYGVGMQIAARDHLTVVVSPFEGSPAYKAGIRPGDSILNVDGKSCEGLNTTDVADLLKGPKGTEVHITLGREGWDAPIEVSIVRDEIPRSGVEYAGLLRPGLGYVRVPSFNETTDADLSDALAQINYRHLDGLIVDLRGNPGGLLNEAVGMAGMFLEKGQLVVYHRGRASIERTYKAVHGNQGIDVPLIVLINSQSASASEIVAGAIQDHDRGLIVGETSFGKGLVQTQYPLSDDTALLLTTARYYTPSGRLIQRAYKDVSLYDYHYNPKPPTQPELKFTSTGRKVYGGGGITPDVVVPVPKLDTFQDALLDRGVFFSYSQGVGDFTRYYLGQQRNITASFAVTDAVMNSFRAYLDTQHIPFTASDIETNASWIKSHIQREVFTSVFGLSEGYRIELEDDYQLQRAEVLIPQAKAIYDNARKILAQRTPNFPTTR